MNPTLQTIYERDSATCWLCLLWVEEEDASVDHVLPRSMGGTRAMRNLRLAHKLCNQMRGNKFPDTLPQATLKRALSLRRQGKKIKPYQIRAMERRERVKKLMERINGLGE